MRHKLKPIRLVLFFTRGVSLHTWAQNGSLEREIALYLRLQQQGVKISFVTYGDKTDLKYKDALQGIEILCNRWNLSRRWYELLIPFLHGRALCHAGVIKTNQTNGADVALRAAKVWRKPLVARCGYMWSEFAERSGKPDMVRLARQVEKDIFTNSQRIVVTTPAMQDFIEKKYQVDARKISVFPNYVMTDKFSLQMVEPVPNRICFIGRLTEQKNLKSLLCACEGLSVELHFAGEGHLMASLQEDARTMAIPLVLHGNLPHHQLPELIHSSAVFVLPSTYEGHPKSLLEAMSCGAAVLGADSPGIREQIKHGETGWLCGTDEQSIRTGIQHLLNDPPLREKIGRNARRFIEENYSLDKVVELEYSLLKDFIEYEN